MGLVPHSSVLKLSLAVLVIASAGWLGADGQEPTGSPGIWNYEQTPLPPPYDKAPIVDCASTGINQTGLSASGLDVFGCVCCNPPVDPNGACSGYCALVRPPKPTPGRLRRRWEPCYCCVTNVDTPTQWCVRSCPWGSNSGQESCP